MFNYLFNLIHGNRLIYNACWEDPQIDRQLLKIDGDSRIVMITSAGCNALDYLLDGPREIRAVDVNFRQNALLELKLALFARRNFEDLFGMFGEGRCKKYQEIYQDIRDMLPPAAQQFLGPENNVFQRPRLAQIILLAGGEQEILPGCCGGFYWETNSAAKP